MDDLAWACIRALLHSGAADNEGGAAIVADLIPNAMTLRWVTQLCEHLCLTRGMVSMQAIRFWMQWCPTGAQKRQV